MQNNAVNSQYVSIVIGLETTDCATQDHLIGDVSPNLRELCVSVVKLFLNNPGSVPSPAGSALNEFRW